MKTFSLICDQGHGFELMVKSLESLEDQQARGLVTCPYCNSGKVERTLATPAVKGGKGRGNGSAAPAKPAKPEVPMTKLAAFCQGLMMTAEFRTIH